MKSLVFLLALMANTACAQILTNKLDVGDGTNGDKMIRARTAAPSATRPALKWNQTDSKWQFSNDGSTFQDFGSGSGGGGGGVNLLTDNPGFEQGTTGWTASGGSFTASAVDPLFGEQSGVFNASALSQTLTSTAYSMPVGLQGGNCLIATGYVYASGADGDYSVQAWDGSTVLATQELSVSTTPATAYLGFACPSSGTVSVRYIANVADPGDLKLDGPSLAAGSIHLGSNILLAQVGNSEFYGSLSYLGASACTWTISQSTYAADYALDNDCATPTVTGKVSAPATKVPQILLNNATAGHYVVTVTFKTNSGGGTPQYRLVDGDGTELGRITANSSDVSPTVIVGNINYTSTANRVIKLQGAAEGATNADVVNNTTNNGALTFTVLKFPTQTQTVLGGLDAMAMSWSGYHNAACEHTNNSGTFADFTASGNANCALVERYNRNFGAVASTGGTGASATAGITFTAKKAGRYFACTSFNANSSAGERGNVARLIDGSSNVIWVKSYPVNSIRYSNVEGCGIVNVSNAGSTVTLKLQTKVGGDTTTLKSSFGAAVLTDSNIEWTIAYLDQGFPMPHLVNLPTNEAVILKDVQPSGTPAGTFTAGSYVTRVLNTVENPSGHTWVSLSSNQFTLAPGTYRIRARAPAVKVDIHKAKIRNITDSVDAIVGNAQQTSTTAGSQSTNDAWVEGVITIASSKTFELQHRCTSTFASNGLGTTATLGESEIFATVEIVKVK